ncbi:hypothetical protein JIG36_30355 [Actinoplanes sp. LDG1-06]|uniref:Uncharacterized protein n=1 Tax=Paractinoplanes ovalisporus TaxID=2810368 RepID=A0ABS2AKP1_9ACTN|nr:hypothetical protein [Actinoplanes ovalisporus]MBM2619821.1 hypothetical protein [Actinoplanes ovalisporus]
MGIRGKRARPDPDKPAAREPLGEANGLRKAGYLGIGTFFLCGGAGLNATDDPAIERIRFTYVIVAVLAVPATIWAFRSAKRAQRAAEAQYGALLPPERPGYRATRHIAVVMWNLLGVAVLVGMLTAQPDPGAETRSIDLPPLARALISIFLVATLVVSFAAAMMAPGTRSAAHRAEQLAKWRRQVEPLSTRLAADINAQLERLENIRDVAAREDELRRLIEHQTDPAIDLLIERVNDKQAGRQVHANRIQVVVAAGIGIVTGIFVNWITGPLLHW